MRASNTLKQKIIVGTLIAAVGVASLFGCKKPAEEGISRYTITTAFRDSARCVSASPDKKLVIVDHDTTIAIRIADAVGREENRIVVIPSNENISGYMFLNGEVVDGRVRVTIRDGNKPKTFNVSYDDTSGKVPQASVNVPECKKRSHNAE
ncbi:MAG: hypothetical protein V1492_04650 [Candidatus Micrarchaeota archaeon]